VLPSRAAKSRGMLPISPPMQFMSGRYPPAPIMFGSMAIGFGVGAATTGVMVTGPTRDGAVPGNGVIGTTLIGVITGAAAIGGKEPQSLRQWNGKSSSIYQESPYASCCGLFYLPSLSSSLGIPLISGNKYITPT
jgi:hypothetical protein